MSNPRVRIPKPHKKQREFIESSAKRKIIRAGRRGGKTVGVGILALEAFRKGHRILYGAPTDDQIQRFWNVITTALQEPIARKVFYKNETKHIIELLGTEQRIRAKTCWNADTLRGDYADLLILDEWQLMNEDAWELVGAPMLVDNNGDAVFIYTPPSMHSTSVTKARDPQHAAKMFKKAEADTSERWGAFHFSSLANPFISEEGLSEITNDMSSLAYKQEILAEDIDEIPGALWTRGILDEHRVTRKPEMLRIGVGIDPQGRRKESSETGICVGGLGTDRHGYMLDDRSMNGRPEEWGREAVQAYHDWEADFIVAETNYGGEMVKAVIRSIDPDIRVIEATASRGKIIRAEPISTKTEKGLIHHVGTFPKLEDEMCYYTPDVNWSPNRLDSYVWVFTELLLKDTGSYKESTSIGAERDSGHII